MNMDLSNRTALVSGSSQGIGLASARALAEMGARLTLIARNEDALKKACQELPGPGPHRYLVADFSAPETLRMIITKDISDNGGYDILVNNTGGPPGGPITEAQTDEFLKAFNAHLICNHILATSVLPEMKKKKFGRVINIISTSVKQPLRGLGVSNTIRAAVANWSKTLATEVAPFNITVNNVLPGATATARLKSIIENKSAKNKISKTEAEEELLAEIPMGRFAEAEEIAAAVAFLASPMASYITGINIPVDGGRTSSL